jgi:hypothetical protein
MAEPTLDLATDPVSFSLSSCCWLLIHSTHYQIRYAAMDAWLGREIAKVLYLYLTLDTNENEDDDGKAALRLDKNKELLSKFDAWATTHRTTAEELTNLKPAFNPRKQDRFQKKRQKVREEKTRNREILKALKAKKKLQTREQNLQSSLEALVSEMKGASSTKEEDEDDDEEQNQPKSKKQRTGGKGKDKDKKEVVEEEEEDGIILSNIVF